jgi:DNA (cytosine-5)-methyltransferase 1
MSLTFVSLFSGVGGFDLGLERAGWRCVAQVEWDKQCQAVLARHWPDVPRWADVADVRGDELPPADVVAFGSPCQDLSVAGRRAGFVEGGRSNLFFEAIRIIKEMRDATDGTLPRFVVWENVVGALSSNQGADFAAVIDALAEVGAVDIGWRVLDARWFGVPQRRRRVFVVADLAGRCAGAVSTEPEGVRWDSDEGGAAWAGDPGGAARGLASGGVTFDMSERGRNGEVSVEPTRELAAALRAGDGGSSRSRVIAHTHTTALTAGLASGGPDAAHACAGWLVSHREGHSSPAAGVAGRATDDRCGRCNMGGGAVSDPLPFSKAGRARSVDDGETWVPGEVSPTLNAFDNGTESRATVTITTGTVVRRLTPLECERLMGWPDDHTRWRADGTEVSDSARYRMCGNGVASPVAAYVAACINRALEQEATDAA